MNTKILKPGLIPLAVVTLLVMIATLTALAAELPPLPNQLDHLPMVDLKLPAGADSRNLWHPMTETAPVSSIAVGPRHVLRLPCNFADTNIDRAGWDLDINLNLTFCQAIQFLFHCPDTEPVSHFSLYFHSPDGWYASSFSGPQSKSWEKVIINKTQFNIEGRPGGWDRIDRLRISAWRGKNQNTSFYLADLGLLGTDAKIAVIRNDAASGTIPAETKSIKKYTDLMSRLLNQAGFAHYVISDQELPADKLQNLKLIILPYNPAPTEDLISQLTNFIQTGGKLLCCYQMPPALQQLCGVRIKSHLPQKQPGNFASIRPSAQSLQGLPTVTLQNSWNIMDADPIENRSRVAAWWFDNQDHSTEKAAVIVSTNCVFITHVLLDDDPQNKQQLLWAIIAALEPQLASKASEYLRENLAQFGPFSDYAAAITELTKLSPPASPARKTLDQAVNLYQQLLRDIADKNYSQIPANAQKITQILIDAYCLAQQPLAGEHRAFWCHSAFGVSGMTWDQAVKNLADNGFTAVLPNMLWGGVAYYPSKVLPTAPQIAEKGDQIELCLNACKKYGVQCHVWKVNFNMGYPTDATFVAKMKSLGRTQISFDGSQQDRWLCPSHPANQQLEIDAMAEIAQNYDVHGLHFDYIRYPNRNGCFCPGCRERFEAAINQKIANWPADIRQNDQLNQKWIKFRQQQINNVVAGLAKKARKIRPYIKISAAVFPNWTVDRNNFGQDWKLWCEKGYLDFVCPMDYTVNPAEFKNLVKNQLEWAGSVPCYPGIGLSVWPKQNDIAQLIEFVNITRQLNTGGFTVFNYGPNEANKILPRCGQGLSRK
ncbi:MAG: family 10 glycosylhydrolase [Sedimentisphaerales bacterium]|nr:family 10 glycosylhydrolase [Sedimentisphaerales bacterium]